MFFSGVGGARNRPTTEAEYIALSAAAQEALWNWQLIDNIAVKSGQPVIHLSSK